MGFSFIIIAVAVIALIVLTVTVISFKSKTSPVSSAIKECWGSGGECKVRKVCEDEKKKGDATIVNSVKCPPLGSQEQVCCIEI